ncbi:MAG TPA: PLP-dependent aminotransferase family protein [Synergistales bacterium]|nr:PLP-dependent aminotransferase family protein [Synergistales bacterium]
MIEIPLEPGGMTPLYRQIAGHLRRMVQNGTLSCGDRLPGSRELAQSLGISRTTAVMAYDLLEDDGFIERKGRRGSFVSLKRAQSLIAPSDTGPIWDLASGLPSGDLVPWERVASITRENISFIGPGFMFDTPLEGSAGLRKALVRHAARRGIPAKRDEAIVTSGARHALSLTIDAMALKGVRRLWIEELTYPEAVRMAAGSGIDVTSVPMDQDAFVESLSRIERGEVLYLVPSFHNPTGRTLPIDIRKEVLSSASKRGFLVVEDDAYGELRFCDSSVPALKSIDTENRVIYIGSFSQLLFPGMRIGYVLLPDDIRDEFLKIMERTSGSTSSLVQNVVHAFIEDGSLESSLENARRSMSERMATLCREIGEKLPCFTFEQPQGGIYLWLGTHGLGGEEAARLASEADVAVVPGRHFVNPNRDIEAVRLSVSRVSPAMITEAVQRLSRVWG